MPLQSDITVNAARFDPSRVTEKTKQLNEKLVQIWKDGPRWYEVGAPEYRKLRWEGKTPLPKPVVLEEGVDFTIPSRDEGREIPMRKFEPKEGGSKGLFLHMHGGGWVLQSEKYQDPYLKYMADHYNLTVISVGYRLAPEDPWPACIHDCEDAATYFIEHGKEKFGGELLFAGGESAGGHLAVLLALSLLKSHPTTPPPSLLLHCGCYDVSTFLPFMHNHGRALIIDHDIMASYIRVLLPNTSDAERRDPSISPFYADLRGKKLPSAMFTCGTEDPLLDDSVCMGAKWGMYGRAVVRFYEGAPHGVVGFTPGVCEGVQEVLDDTVEFVKEELKSRGL